MPQMYEMVAYYNLALMYCDKVVLLKTLTK